jgi:hypothetical protein
MLKTRSCASASPTRFALDDTTTTDAPLSAAALAIARPSPDVPPRMTMR